MSLRGTYFVRVPYPTLWIGRGNLKHMIEIDAANLTHRVLNENLRRAIVSGNKEIRLKNVLGQRFIAAGLRDKVRIEIDGISGNDLAVFMDGPEIYLRGNGEDGVGNTISGGKITIFGTS